MIEVSDLTKKYAGVAALRGISFQVGKGEIVGFLGPNGAGKSTTMRILSGYLPASSGRASVAGFDVFRESLKARERIGYMPENVPLYPDMRVTEYLRYRAALKGVRGRRISERVEEVKDLCGLKDVETKLIAALSKGYRQRVGLADAMVHEPDLLILDEPTIGLDPNQIRQVRQLIKNLGRHHTILLSTHILPEVEMTCSRVVIINKGKIEASGSPQDLRKGLRGGAETVLEAKVANAKAALELLRKIEGVSAAEAETEEGWTRFALASEGDCREALHAVAVREKWPVRELTQRRVTLEDVFAEITQADEV